MTGILKKYAIAAAVGLFSLCFVGAANAVVDTPSSLTFETLSALNTPVEFTGHQDGAGVNLSSDGQDVISFLVDSSFSGSATTIGAKIWGNGWHSFSTSLWNDTGSLADGTVTGDPGSGGWTSIFSFSPLTASGSPYYIHIDGITKEGSSHATYSGTLTLSPIPEPETYAMILAGLGLMGFIARRRKQNAAA